MIELGKFNRLKITGKRNGEYLLDGDSFGEIVLVDRDADATFQTGAMLDVFVYINGRNQLQATLGSPYAQAGEVAWLKVIALSHAGVFMDWGMPNDLLVPFSEQKNRMVEGRFYLVRLFLDENNRIVASTRLDDFIKEQAFYLKEGQLVDFIIADETEIGFKAVIDHQYWGLLYKNEIFQPLEKGQKLTGYIKKIRPDHKIDLALTVERYRERIDDVSKRILSVLNTRGGFLALTDKSCPQSVYKTLGVSKKVFKQAIGGLYKQRKIIIEESGIRLIQS